MRFLHEKISLAGTFAKIPITVQDLSALQVLKIPMDIWKDHVHPAPASTTSKQYNHHLSDPGWACWEEQWSLRHAIWERCPEAWIKARYFSKMPLCQFHWNNFKFVFGAQSDLVIALKLSKQRHYSLSPPCLTQQALSLQHVILLPPLTPEKGR